MLVRSLPARLALATCFGGALVAGGARAETPVTSALSWVRLPGAESCITTPELGERVEKHLGRPALMSPSVADVSIEGRVARTEAGGTRYKAIVGGTRRDGRSIGTREITSSTSDCRSLDDGLVLVIALMIDPNAHTPARPEPAPPPASPSVVTREIVRERVIVRELDLERSPPRASPWLVQGALTGAASIARLPGVAPAAGLALRAGPSRLVAFELSLGAVPSQTLSVGSRAVDYTLLEGGLAICPTAGLGARVEVGGCAGVRLGAIRTRGRRFETDNDVDRGLADVAAGPRLTVKLAGPVFALASVSALLPLVRQETTVRDAGALVVIDRRAPLGGEVGLGAGIHFSP
ncbi:MAG: hypothetical protein KIS78_08305 [Labilithrix sp.]|nr:hypothetical protein [Labilithrix sp.]